MNLRNNLQARILLFILSAVLLVFIAVGLFVGLRNKNLAVKNAREYTQLLASENANEVKSIFEKYKGQAHLLSELYATQLNIEGKLSSAEIEGFINAIINNEAIEEAWFLVQPEFVNDKQEEYSSYLFIEKRNSQGSAFVANTTIIKKYESQFGNVSALAFSEPYKRNGLLLMDMYAPVYSKGSIIGQSGFTLNMNLFSDFIANSDIYEGGFITVMSNTSVFVGHSNADFIGNRFSDNFPEEDKRNQVEHKVAEGRPFAISTKFENAIYYSYFAPMVLVDGAKPWMVEVTIPMHKILEESKKSIFKSIFFALAGIFILFIVIWRVTKRIISPIKGVTDILEHLSTGDTKNITKLEIQTGDELEKMSNSLNRVIEGLQKTEGFALEIGKGNLDNDYDLLGEQDQLGQALLTMRNSLKVSKTEEEERKKEEAIRNWATEGIAKFAEILRQDNNDMKKLSFNVMSNLINYLGVNQGAMFVLNNDDEDNSFYELNSAIAYGRDKFMTKEVQIGEGLVGRCAYERKTIFLKEVPDDYVNITSGLGTANPKCVLIVPCILNDEVFGILEIASFSVLEKHEIEFVEKLGESIGATISSVKVNEKTTKLLRASQQQGEELAAQEEEMRQNLEEMQATQEDLQRQNQANEQMRENLAQQTALLNALLSNLPDYIYFKDVNSKFLRISNSMLHLFGADTVDEVIGKSDFDFKSQEEAQKYFNDEQEIIKSRKAIKNQLQREVMVNGSVQWNSVTKMPLIDDENKVIGTFGISKDVTALKQLEIDSGKKQAELKSILESVGNSTYMIQYDTQGIIIDANDAVLELFAVAKNEILGTHHREGFDFKGKTEEDYQKLWNRIVGGEIVKEVNKITVNEKAVWLSETYNPIRNENGDIYKIMKLAFDITECMEK